MTEPTHRRAVGAAIVAAVFGLLVVALTQLPDDHAPLPAVAREAVRVALPRWHITEPVNEVVYGTRGFDTFGETFLLLAAVVSVVLLTRPRERRAERSGEEQIGRQEEAGESSATDSDEREARSAEDEEAGDRDDSPQTPDIAPVGTPRPERAEEMTVVVRTAARIVAPVLAVAGFYLAAWGYAPGGGFPAGAVVLGVVLLIYAGFGHQRVARVTRPASVELVELLGAIGIVVIGLLGLFLKGSFFTNWVPLAPEQTIRSGGILQLFSGAELIEVASGLVLAVFSLLVMRHDWSRDESDDRDSGTDR